VRFTIKFNLLYLFLQKKTKNITIGNLKKVLSQYPDYDICLFDDYADEFGDSDGNVKINLDDNCVDDYPLEDEENFIYFITNDAIIAV